jgi:putative SOS response-associated peptidase YedK
VVASGWYEWAAPKKPYYITRRDDDPMGMAGIYWQSGDARQCVIVTTAADGDLAKIHHRAPLVLAQDAVTTWLNPDTSRRYLDPIIAPTHSATFNWHPVSAEVGSPRISHRGLTMPDPRHGAQPEAQPSLF